MAQQATVGPVRLSYVNVFEPRETPQGTMKYSVTCLLPKSDTKTYETLMGVVKAEMELAKDDKLKGVSKPRLPLHDGDGVSPTGVEYGPECKGHWVFTASANAEYPPHLVDQRVQPIMDHSQIYSGCWGYVALSVYAYNNQSRGIGFGLNGIQKVRDDEPLGYSFNVSSAFKPIEGGSGSEACEVDDLLGFPL